MCLLLYNEYASNNTDYDSPKQGGFPVIVLEMINISDTDTGRAITASA